MEHDLFGPERTVRADACGCGPSRRWVSKLQLWWHPSEVLRAHLTT